jgi:hypothetical protein
MTNYSQRIGIWVLSFVALGVLAVRVNTTHGRQSNASAKTIYQQALHEE